MISFLAKHKNIILVVVIVCFLGGMGYGGFAALKDSSSPNSPIAVIGAETITAGKFDLALRLMEEQYKKAGMDIGEDQSKMLKNMILSRLVYESTMVQTAKQYGLHVSDYEVAYRIRTSPMFSQDGWFDKKIYIWTVRNNLHMTPEDYENTERRTLTQTKMMALLASAFKATPQEIQENYRTQYAGNMKKFEENKATFAPTILENKFYGGLEMYEKYFNANNEIKVMM